MRIPLSVPKRYWKTNGSRGRKLGSLTKRTREIAQGALASGLTPLEYMLATMRDVTVDDARRDDMAKAAAPYMAGWGSSMPARTGEILQWDF